ncbi:MAG: DUF3566 domain-containing protein [Nocardioides sp.]|nr:DUF3566 domain-containing protein [Nocardioides sp.]
MAERPTTRPTAAHDDTAVRPLPRTEQRPASGSSNGSTTAAPTPVTSPSGGAQGRKPQAPTAKSVNKRPAAAAPAAPAPTRRARLRLTRLDPWSVMKTAFLLSIAFAVVSIVSVFMVWSVLSAAGVWESINSTVQDIVGGQETAGFDVEDYLGTSRVLGFTMLVSVVNVFLLTAVATLAAFLYNMAAQLLGGIEVTLAEDS